MQRSRGIRDVLPALRGLTRQVLLVGGLLLLGQLVVEGWLHWPVTATLAWWPLRSGAFAPWQPLTALLLVGSDPIWSLMGGMLVYSLLPPLEAQLGRAGLARAMGFVTACVIVGGLLVQVLGLVDGSAAFAGPWPHLMAMLVLFAYTHQQTSVRLYFVLPVPALWLAWAGGALALFGALASWSLSSALLVIGWIGAWLWVRGVSTPLRRVWLRMRYAWLHRRLRRLQVIEGGRGRRRDEGGGGPLFH